MDNFHESRTLDQHIVKLRKRIEADPAKHAAFKENKEGRTYVVLCRTSAAVLPCFDGERSLAELELAFLRKAAPLFGTVFANQKMQSSVNWRREGGGAIYLMIRREEQSAQPKQSTPQLGLAALQHNHRHLQVSPPTPRPPLG